MISVSRQTGVSFGVGEHSTVRSSLEEHARDSGVVVDPADREGHEII
jgi:hypothetical protein